MRTLLARTPETTILRDTAFSSHGHNLRWQLFTFSEFLSGIFAHLSQ